MNLFSEFKRRGVFQVGMAYTVVSWLLIQVASILFPTFDAPVWYMQATVWVLVLGFPIALVISWVFDLTARGLVRTEDMDVLGIRSPVDHGMLNHVIIGLLSAAVLLFALDKFYWKTKIEPTHGPDRQSIAVLPFKNMSGDVNNDPLAVGIHDDLLTQISKISALRTISRTSVLRYAQSEKTIPEIAEELGVAIIVEGGVQRSADRIRINAQLIDTATDSHLWAETFDRQFTATNIFAIQSDISRSIARALRATLTPDEEQALDNIPTENLEAFEAYAIARTRLDAMGQTDTDEAISGFTLATELDPEFAAAWAGLCVARLGKYTHGSERQYFDAAEVACQKAMSLDDQRIEVHVALGTLYRYFGQYSRAEVSLQRANYAKAEQVLENALSIGGTRVEALVELGLVLARQNRLVEAETILLRAAVIDPGYWSAQNALFSFYYSFSDRPDRFERAAKYAAQSASLRPDLAAGWNNLGSANYMLSQYDQAADAWQQSLAIEPTRTAYTNTGLALYNSRRFEESAAMQLKAIEIAPSDHRAWGRMADALRFTDANREYVADNYLKAAELARERLEINEQDWQTHGQLAIYLAHLDDKDNAVSTIQRALNLSRRNAETLLNAAIVQFVTGQSEAALDLLEETVAKDANYRDLIKIDPDLNQMANQQRFQSIISPPVTAEGS